MRADRLLSMISLLQIHGRMTAQQLSHELEVSERTIYRDVTALSTAGIPIYTEGGHGGGISPIEDYQTDLTRLNPDEVQALSMLDIPELLMRLGMGQKLKAILLKLSAAVPASLRERQIPARQLIHLDAAWWFQPEDPTPCLETINQAVWQDHLLQTTTQGDFGALSEHTIAPYGLVAKASIWYLVYEREGHLRARRVSRIVSAIMLEQSFLRPPDFNLAEFWQQWCADFENSRPRYEVQALVSPTLADRLPHILQNKQPDLLNMPPKLGKEGWRLMTLTFESFEVARTRLLGFGGAVEVLEPLALRYSLVDYAKQIVGKYEMTQNSKTS
jgi:predicted DNA-binding transcriptional regulator YafY